MVLGPIDTTDPVDHAHPLNRGRVHWWLALPHVTGTNRLFDLLGRNHGALTNLTASGSGWRPATRPGGFGEIGFASTASRRVQAATGPHLARITVACWAKPGVLTRGDLVSRWSNGSAAGDQFDLLYGLTSGKPQFFVRAGSASSSSGVGSAVMAVGNWHHVAGTYDGATIRVYLDGTLQASASYAESAYTATETYTIGNNSAGNGPLTGSIDDAAIFDRVLSGDEVRELFRLSRLGYPGAIRRRASTTTVILTATGGSTAMASLVATSASLAATATAAGGGVGTITHLASVATVSSDAISVTSSAIDTTGADLVVASVSWYYPGSAGPIVLADSEANTWTPLTLRGAGDSAVQFFYCPAPTTDPVHTVSASVAGSPSIYPVIEVSAYSGADATPFLAESGDTADSATSLQPGSLTPAEDNCLLLTAVCIHGGNTISADGGFAETTTDNGPNNMGAGIAHLVQTSAAAANPTWSWTVAGSGDAAAALAVFRPAAAGGTASLVATSASLAATATASAPTYTATAALAAGASSLAATATFATATFAATATLSSSAATLAATASSVAPTYSGTSALEASAATLAGSATFTAPAAAVAPLAAYHYRRRRAG